MFDELVTLTVDAYIQNYGQVEVEEIMQSLNKSKRFMDNIKVAMHKNEVPSLNALEGIVRSASFKMNFSKKRKVYFGAIYYLKTLHTFLKEYGFPIDDYEFGKRMLELRNFYQIESGK